MVKRLRIKVVPNSKEESVGQAEGYLRVRVNAPAREGRANKRAIELLHEHLGIPKSNIELVAGATARIKTFLIK